jgi:hypothetical protein
MDKYFDYFWAAAASALRFYQLFAARPKMLTAPRISTPSLFVAARELDECCVCAYERKRTQSNQSAMDPLKLWYKLRFHSSHVVKIHIVAVIPQNYGLL